MIFISEPDRYICQQMKVVIAYVLAAMIAFPVLLKSGILGYWTIHRQAIAEKWCDFRNDKNSNCHGKCYLLKKIKGTDQRDPVADWNFALRLLKNAEQEPAIRDNRPDSFSPKSTLPKSPNIQDDRIPLHSFAPHIFQPPEVRS